MQVAEMVSINTGVVACWWWWLSPSCGWLHGGGGGLGSCCGNPCCSRLEVGWPLAWAGGLSCHILDALDGGSCHHHVAQWWWWLLLGVRWDEESNPEKRCILTSSSSLSNMLTALIIEPWSLTKEEVTFPQCPCREMLSDGGGLHCRGGGWHCQLALVVETSSSSRLDSNWWWQWSVWERCGGRKWGETFCPSRNY